VADAFSAMTTNRPYRKAVSIQEALHRLEDAAGSQFDGRLVTVFVTGIETADNAPLPGDGRPLRRMWTPQTSVA
jgi:HD-GYP domain-containing protein (c-di-GMP phosphodiesterase class II)